MAKALFFDIDGTLWDCTDAAAAGFTRVLQDAPESGRTVTGDDLKKLFGKTIWVYTGYRKEEIPAPIWRRLSHYISYLVDGRYSDRLRNPQLHFRGSSNQRIWRKNKLGEWRIIDFDELMADIADEEES